MDYWQNSPWHTIIDSRVANWAQNRARNFFHACLICNGSLIRPNRSSPSAATRDGRIESLPLLKKRLRRHAEQDLPDRLEMGAACLDLLRERVDVAEAAFERAV